MGTELSVGRRKRLPDLSPAGLLLPISALGADGTLVLEDGSIVHIVDCRPRNVSTMDSAAVEATFQGLRALAAVLEPGQVLQAQVEGDLIDTREHMRFYREQLQVRHRFAAEEIDDPASLEPEQRARWALERMLHESVGRSAPDGFAPRRRCYLIVRYRPELDLTPNLAQALPAWMPGAAARRNGDNLSLSRLRRRKLREHQRVVRRAFNRVRGFVDHLGRDGIAGRILHGEEVLRYLRSRCNPTSLTWGRLEDEADWNGVLSRFDSQVEADEARRAARQLRELVAQSPMDFASSMHHGEVEQDLVRVGYLGGRPSSTRTFWLQELLSQPLPFTLSVYLHGLSRSQVQDEINRAWHQAQRENERRAEKGRRDKESERQELEQEQLVDEMADDPQAGLVELSLYLLLRAPGPQPDVHELDEAAHHAGQIVHRATAGGILMPGTREQEDLWRSTLPIGLDIARKTLRFGMDHAADTLPLMASSCGSPDGLPLLVAPTGEIECLNPFDRAHDNYAIVVAGTTGTGKTMFANRLVAHLVALGATGYVFDRAQHYEVLGDLIPGARTIRIGADDSEDTINHWDVPDPANAPRAKIRFLVELHRVMLDLDLTRQQEALLAHCIRATYLHCAAQNHTPRERELVRFMKAYAAHEARHAGNERTIAVLEGLIDELGEFVEDGIYAHVWDRETNLAEDAPLLIFDTSGASDRLLIPLMFATMEWVRARVRADRERATQSPIPGARFHGLSIVHLDEGWSWAQVPELATHIQHWARQSRHYGTCFVVMSQDSKDFSGQAEAIITNAAIKVLFRQSPAMLAFLRRSLQLAPEIVGQVQELRSVKGAYSEVLIINGGRGAGRGRLVVGPHEYWAYTSEPHHDVPRRRQAIARRRGDAWGAIAELARDGIPRVDDEAVG